MAGRGDAWGVRGAAFYPAHSMPGGCLVPRRPAPPRGPSGPQTGSCHSLQVGRASLACTAQSAPQMPPATGGGRQGRAPSRAAVFGAPPAAAAAKACQSALSAAAAHLVPARDARTQRPAALARSGVIGTVRDRHSRVPPLVSARSAVHGARPTTAPASPAPRGRAGSLSGAWVGSAASPTL